MTRQQFTIEELLMFGWAKTKQHGWFLACTAFIFAIIIGSTMDHGAPKFVPELLNPFTILVLLLSALSLMTITLVISKDHSFGFSDIFSSLRSPKITLKFLLLMVPYAFISVLTVLLALLSVASLANDRVPTAILLGLLTLPGMYVAIRFKLYPYVIIENENMSLESIILHSYNLMNGNFWKVVGFFCVIAAINLAGMWIYCVGLIFTLPVSLFAMAHLYRRLSGHHGA